MEIEKYFSSRSVVLLERAWTRALVPSSPIWLFHSLRRIRQSRGSKETKKADIQRRMRKKREKERERARVCAGEREREMYIYNIQSDTKNREKRRKQIRE